MLAQLGGNRMKRNIVLAVPLLFFGPAAFAATASSNSGLSLAALVAQYSPLVTTAEKAVLNAYLGGRATAHFPPGKTIVVKADEVNCRITDVDITLNQCTLTFGKRNVPLGGRLAHELYATLVENGVHSGAAAGSIYAIVKDLECTIDPAQVRQRAGGGAT
jgi:hypothetical protein